MFNCLLLNYSSSAATRTTHEESITRENISQWQKYFNVQSAGNKTSSPEISVFARALRSPNVRHGWFESAASFQIHFIFHRLLEREVKWRVWGQQRRLLSWYLLTSKCPQLCGRDGAGLGTICDNCDDNDILVCNVCVHTVSRVKTLNTRWWGSGGHWGSAPRVSTSSPAPLSFLTQLRSETTQPTVSLARCWYKLNVIPSQGSVINYPGLSCICVAFAIKFLSSSSQQTIIWFVTPCSSSGLNYNKIGSQFSEHFSSVSIIRRVHLLFMRNICSILLPSSCHHSISHFLWPSCRVCDTFHSRIAPGPQHPLADIFHLLRNFYQSSPLPRVPRVPVHMQILSPLHR